MSELEQYQQTPAPALRVAPEPVSTLPATAHALVEWAASARAAYELAERLVDTPFSPVQYKGKPMHGCAAILAGAEVGLSPMAALRSFDVIQGVAAPRALTLRAIAQSAGHEVVVVSASSQEVVMKGRRRGSSEWQSVTWTLARARQLGLADKQQWKSQPQTMLTARATSDLVRLIAADAVLGIGYSVEELDDAEPAPTVPVSREPAPVAKRTIRRAPAARQAEEPDLDEAPARAPEVAEAPRPPEPEPDDVPPELELLTPAQHKRLHVYWRGQFGGDRDARLAHLTETLGRPITTSNRLTKAEAHRLLEQLDRQDVSPPEPPAHDDLGPETEPHWAEAGR